jgi:hypothetical protein
LHFPREVKQNTNYYISEIITPFVMWLVGWLSGLDGLIIATFPKESKM